MSSCCLIVHSTLSRQCAVHRTTHRAQPASARCLETHPGIPNLRNTGFQQVVIATCNPSGKLAANTRESRIHLIWFSLMVAVCRKNCSTNVSRKYGVPFTSSQSWSPEHKGRIHVLSFTSHRVVHDLSFHAPRSQVNRLLCNLRLFGHFSNFRL